MGGLRSLSGKAAGAQAAELFSKNRIALSKCIHFGRHEMLVQNFSERAAECILLAERARSEHDRDLFIELARAWCGVTAQTPKAETQPRH
jgi:hypothetical protein